MEANGFPIQASAILKIEKRNRRITVDELVGLPRSSTCRQGLTFSSVMGRPLTKAIGGHLFDDIEKAAEFVVSPHSLRRYFGSSLISGGVSVVAVSRWLGHSSPEITWRVYSYLMACDEDAGRAAMAATLGRVVPVVYPLCTRAVTE